MMRDIFLEFLSEPVKTSNSGGLTNLARGRTDKKSAKKNSAPDDLFIEVLFKLFRKFEPSIERG